MYIVYTSDVCQHPVVEVNMYIVYTSNVCQHPVVRLTCTLYTLVMCVSIQ